MRFNSAYMLAALFVLLLTAAPAFAGDVSVDCTKKKTITEALAGLSKQGPNTIHVTGACNESVLIDGFEDLALLANPGASINDPTPSVPDDNDVVDIVQSRNVTVQGFTINGGLDGVTCLRFSVCYLRNLTVQGAADTGVFFNRSSGFVDNTAIQNTLFGGIAVNNGSEVTFGSGIFEAGTATIQNNGAVGAQVGNNSHLTLTKATIQNHPSAGVSVEAGSVLRLNSSTITGSGEIGAGVDGSILALINSTITGSGGFGISATSSVVRFQPSGTGPDPPTNTISVTNNAGGGVELRNTSSLEKSGGGFLTITGNAGNGISIGHLSFLRLRGPRTISGNGSPDVNCTVSTAKTEGTGGSATPNLGGGTTNCTEPAP